MLEKTTIDAPAIFPSAPRTLAGIRRLLEKRLKESASTDSNNPLERGHAHGLSIALGTLELVADGREGWTFERALERLKAELGNARLLALQDNEEETNKRLLEEGIANGLETAVELITCFGEERK